MGRLQTFVAHTYPKLAVVVPTPHLTQFATVK